MNLDKNPYEAGLGPFIKPNKKTKFIGQEACQKISQNDLKCKLVVMTVDTHGFVDPEGNETVWFDNKVCLYCCAYTWPCLSRFLDMS